MIRVALLFGGPSVEHEVSIRSCRAILQHLDRSQLQPILLGLTRERQWVEGKEAEKMLQEKPYRPSQRDLGALLETYSIDVVFPIIHGTFGEDGVLQGYLEALGVPYVGCGPKASAIGMDKAMQKALWSQQGLPIVPYKVYYRADPWDIRELERVFSLPVFVKPADLGSSVGITKVTQWEELPRAMEEAFQFSRKVLVEQGIEGRELEVSILGDYEPHLVSVPGEIIPGDAFYSYEDKYLRDEAKILVPADLNKEIQEACRQLARKAFRVLDGYGMARVDFFLEGQDKLYINEINTIPGFTAISMYPKLLIHEGLSFSSILTRLLDLAFARARLDQKKLNL